MDTKELSNLKAVVAILAILLIGSLVYLFKMSSEAKMTQECLDVAPLEVTAQSKDYTTDVKATLPEEYLEITSDDTLKGYFDGRGVLHIEFNNKRNH